MKTIGELLNHTYSKDDHSMSAFVGPFDCCYEDSSSIRKLIGEMNLAGKLDEIRPELTKIGVLQDFFWTNTTLLCKEGENDPVLTGFKSIYQIGDSNFAIVSYDVLEDNKATTRKYVIDSRFRRVTKDLHSVIYTVTKREVDGPVVNYLVSLIDEDGHVDYRKIDGTMLVPILRNFYSTTSYEIHPTSSLDLDLYVQDTSKSYSTFFILDPDLNPLFKNPPLTSIKSLGDYLLIKDARGNSAIYIPGKAKCIPEKPSKMYQFTRNSVSYIAFKRDDGVIILDNSKDYEYEKEYGEIYKHILYEGKGDLLKDESVTNVLVIVDDNNFGIILDRQIEWCTDYRISKFDSDDDARVIYCFKGNKIKMFELDNRFSDHIKFVRYANEFDEVHYTFDPVQVIKSGDKETFISVQVGVVCLKIDRKHLGNGRGAGYDDVFWFDECFVPEDDGLYKGRIGDKVYVYNVNERKLELVEDEQ